MEKITVLSLQKKKKEKIPITALTCYDAFTARLVDSAGIDIALVGDSLANTRLGYSNTLPVTLNEMIHHVKASARGIQHSLLVADMPFQTYEVAPWEAAKAAGRFVKEGGATAVKVEGGRRISKSIQAILNSNIPIMGHIGLTPQSVNKQGGYHVQGRRPAQARELIMEAKLLEKLGVFCLVLEGVPLDLGRKITRSLKIPTIGIGAGPYCDGQILVFDDLMGMTEGPSPKFVAAYAHLRPQMKKALNNFARDVQSHHFPNKEHSYQ